MHNLFIGMNEILKNEKRDYIFEMQPLFSAELQSEKQSADSLLRDSINSDARDNTRHT